MRLQDYSRDHGRANMLFVSIPVIHQVPEQQQQQNRSINLPSPIPPFLPSLSPLQPTLWPWSIHQYSTSHFLSVSLTGGIFCCKSAQQRALQHIGAASDVIGYLFVCLFNYSINQTRVCFTHIISFFIFKKPSSVLPSTPRLLTYLPGKRNLEET